ncbi:hypothetical protein [Pedobacter deserti]|uniref:hypothetical protein n=1 Tax=Pedobacter deserti TaxID=2817382 RepID=UPI00210CFC53|nr:hypothetical protein [Pedobacter sp. SYSU D00382]
MEDKKRSSKRRVLKWIGIVLAVVILLAGGVALYFSAKWKPILTEKIKAGVYDGSDGLYRISFEDIHLNLLTGTAVLDSVKLTADTAVFERLKKTGRAPGHLFDVGLKNLKLSRTAILTAYFKKRIEMNAIVLNQPSVRVTRYKVVKRPDTSGDDRSLYQRISTVLKSVHVKAVQIIDADVDYINGDRAKKMNSIKHLNVTVRDLLIDSLSQFDTTRFYYTRDISFKLAGYASSSTMYTMKVDTIRGSAANQSIVVKGFRMIPKYPDLAFTRKYRYGRDRYDLSFDAITLSGVDFGLLNSSGKLHVRKLKLGPARPKIFVNRELPPPPGLDKGRNFPHVAVRRIPIPTKIDSVVLNNINLSYTEYNPVSQKRGTIYFWDLKGDILNVTNDSIALVQNNHAVARLSAMVMKASKIDVRINFNLNDKDAAFSYSGKIGPMDMKILNPMAKNMGLVEIERGKMQGADFNINANLSGSSGRVNFYYTDLKVKLLKESENGEPEKKKGLLSFLANTLLIKNQNPDKGEAPRTAQVAFTRTPAASFFNMMWKSVFIGIRETVGLGVVPVKTPEQGLKKIKDKMEDRRKERADKKKKRD